MFKWLADYRARLRERAEANWFLGILEATNLPCDICKRTLPAPKGGIVPTRGGACCVGCRAVWCIDCQPVYPGVDMMNEIRATDLPYCPKCSKRILRPL